MPKDVIGFGALNLDSMWRADLKDVSRILGQELREGGEYSFPTEKFPSLTDYLRGNAAFLGRSGGGSAANTVYALQRLGVQCGYVGKVGRDEGSESLINELMQAGVDVSGIIRGDGFCGQCISIKTDGERTMLIFPNINDELKPDEIGLEYFDGAKFIHMTSFACSHGDAPLQAQIYVTQNAKSRISFDPGELYCKKGFGQMLPILQRTYILLMAEEEINSWGFDYEDGSQILLGYGPQTVVCKRGEKGCFVRTRKERLQVPVERVVEGERTGAGDVFNAGFLAVLLYEKDLQTCARFANYVAGKKLTRPGREAYPTKRDLELAIG